MFKSYCYNGFGICYYCGSYHIYGLDKNTMKYGLKYGYLRNFKTEEEAENFIDNLIKNLED